MPTIEIVSVENLNGLNLKQSDFNFAIIEEQELKTHRSLFQSYLDEYRGTIVHLGNPAMINDKDGCFFAGLIVNWDFKSEKEPDPERSKYVIIPCVGDGCDDNDDCMDCNDWDGSDQQFYFQFEEEYLTGVKFILKRSIEESPIKSAFFLTDYQFGPKFCPIIDIGSPESFWKEHNKYGLRFNSLYRIEFS